MNELILTKYGIEPAIIIPEGDFFTLSIENKSFLLECLNELRYQADGGKEGAFNLLLNDKPLNMEKSVSVIFDFTDIDFNSKAITSLLTKNFSEFLGLGEQAPSLINLEDIISSLAESFRVKSGINIKYDAAMNALNLAKVCSLKITDDKRPLLERLCEYVNLLCDLKPLKLFILVFGKQFLNESNIANLHKHCCDKQVRLLFMEGIDRTELIANEIRLIVDKDMCTIVQDTVEY